MTNRAKVNKRFWNKLAAIRVSGKGYQIFRLISRELSRVRMESYAKGFNAGAEFMEKRVRGVPDAK